MNNLRFDEYIVVPSHKMGNTWDKTDRYVWKYVFNRRGFNPSQVAGHFPNTEEGGQQAQALAERLTTDNIPF